MKSFASIVLFLLSSLSVVHAQNETGRFFKNLENGFCMGIDEHHYIYTYHCHHERVTQFERTGNRLVAQTGDSAGMCLESEQDPGHLDSTLDEWPRFKACEAGNSAQIFEFQPDGRWTGHVGGDGYANEYCMALLNPNHIRVKLELSSNGNCVIWYDADTGTVGDPIITGLGGQQFKFDGRDDAWYANIAIQSQSNNIFDSSTSSLFQWNMKFKEFPTCPKGDDMFVSSIAYDFGNGNTVLIATTSEQVPQCENQICLGDGTLHISFDGGETFVSNPGDYNFGVGNRVVSHNTYDACSRKWFDFDISKNVNKDVSLLRGQTERTLEMETEKPALQYLTEQQRSTIRPVECEGWIQERFAKNDLFMQKGQWSTIHIESPEISFHVEYRRNNLDHDVDGQCNFQSLDAWMTRVSKVLYGEKWNGILGETRNKNGVEGRFNILRGQNDSDYEVNGPFVTEFPALHIR